MNSKQVPDTKPTPSTAREWGNKTHDEVYVAIWKTLEPFNAKVSDVSKLTKKILAIFDAHVSSIAPVAAEKAAKEIAKKHLWPELSELKEAIADIAAIIQFAIESAGEGNSDES